MMIEPHKLIVGARGWDHAGWCGTFYPDDLPEDWRLSYYANEFAGVLVPKAVWKGSGEKEVAAWCDEVVEGFLFFLEEPDPGERVRVATGYHDLFGSHWGGVPDTADLLMPADQAWDLRRVREIFERIALQPRKERASGFFLDGDPPNIGHLREARLLADML